jgi:hypothetical protein
MKNKQFIFLSLILTLTSSTVFAQIVNGHYLVPTISCTVQGDGQDYPLEVVGSPGNARLYQPLKTRKLNINISYMQNGGFDGLPFSTSFDLSLSKVTAWENFRDLTGLGETVPGITPDGTMQVLAPQKTVVSATSPGDSVSIEKGPIRIECSVINQ